MVARKIPLQCMERAANLRDGKDTDPPLLQPNQIQLYSFYKPGLLAGNYKIEAEQNITSEGQFGKEELRVYNRKKFDAAPPLLAQEFEVIAPQFSLDPKLVDSYYPPDGHQDEGRVLPHLVLNDPHFPWERKSDKMIDQLWDPDLDSGGKPVNAKNEVVEKAKAVKRNAVPWVALMVFDPEELAPLEPEEILPGVLNLPPKLKLDEQPSTGAIPLTVEQYFSIPKASRVNFEAGLSQEDDKDASKAIIDLNAPKVEPEDPMKDMKGSQEVMTAIFPTKAKLLELFPDIPSLRYASHVRNINTTGFPGAGIDQLGLYSIIVSTRVGNYKTEKPITQICHLVSLEHLETTKQMWKKDNDKGDGRVALISLFSWTYTALPPDPVNFVDSITKVVDSMQPLRPRQGTLESLERKAKAAAGSTSGGILALHKRLSAGYSLARWRCETGEETVAFSRGPLVPQIVAPQPKDWATSSNTSKEYQILDKKTGIMDLSCSSAWQLGKTLAISDTTFSGALARLRSTIQRQSQSKTRAEANSVSSKESLIQAMRSDINLVDKLSSGDVPEPRRVTLPPHNELAPDLESPSIVPLFDKNVADAIFSAGFAGKEIYNGFNKAGHNNTDWTILHTWISDKLYLSDIPAHVLIPDPTFLPVESLRFFHIDDTWLDCLIDGALSVGNHLERDDDRIRQGIKQTYNTYLKDESLGGIRPQIPAYGFFLRSQIVKVMPDLKITIEWQTIDGRYPFCRYIRPDDQTILCLLDRPPEELKFIELSQPSHQQRFSFGYTYDPKASTFAFSLRQLFTEKEENMEKWKKAELQPDSKQIETWFAGSEKSVKGEKPTKRVINFAKMASDVNKLIRDNSAKSEKPYGDFVANSAELALELNDPSYYFKIYAPKLAPGATPAPRTERKRQLWCAEAIPETTSTVGEPEDKPDDSKPIGSVGPPPKLPETTTPIRPIVRQSPSNATHIVIVKTDPIPAPPAAQLKTGNPLQCFDVRIYADYKGLSPSWKSVDNSYDPKDYIPTRNVYLYDLIFSVRKMPSRAKANYDLREIIINIPTSRIAGAAEPLINAGAEGPKVRMLGNQRFVPFLNWTEEYLQVRLVPRSAKEHPVMKISDDRSKEVSFRLQEVDVPEIRTPVWVPIHLQKREQLGLVKVAVYERYETAVGVVSASGSPQNVFVVKRDITDPITYDK